MPDWKKYPLLQLLIPFSLGLIIASLLHHSPILSAATSLIILFFLLAAFHYNRIINKDLGLKRAFGFAVFFVFMFLGMGLMLLRRHQAEVKYGPRYEYEIYRSNRLQNQYLSTFQDKLHCFYLAHGIEGESGAIIEAMTIGRKTDITKPLKRAFSRAGISHLLAISGFHIMFVYLILQILFLGKIILLRWRLVANISTILMLWLYALMTGMQPSIARAVIMCSIMLIANSIQRDSDLLNSSSIAAFIILAIDPLMIQHIGFQLSFFSILGIHFIASPITKNFTNPILSPLLNCIVITFACTLATFPLVAYHFQSIPTLGLLSSLAGSLLTMLIMYLALLWWVVALLLPSIPSPLTTIILFLANSLIRLATYISNFSFSTISYSPTKLEVCFIYFLIYKTVKKFNLYS